MRKKKDLIKQRNLLFYNMIQLDVVFKSHMEQYGAAKNDMEREIANFFLKFNIATFLFFAAQWFRDNFNITINSKDVKGFIADWNKHLKGNLEPEYQKEVVKIREKYKPKSEIDYYQ